VQHLKFFFRLKKNFKFFELAVSILLKLLYCFEALMRSALNVEVSDTTGDEGSTKAGKKRKLVH
jgi:hypothetical protein